MFVAMPTAMPVLPFISRVRDAGGEHRRAPAVLVVVRLPVDGVLVDVRHHLHRRAGVSRHSVYRSPRRVAVGCCRSSPAASPADSAGRSPAPSGPAWGRAAASPVRVVVAGGLARDPWRTCGSGRRGNPEFRSSIACRMRRWTGFSAVAHVRQRARDNDAHRVEEYECCISSSRLIGTIRSSLVAKGCSYLPCFRPPDQVVGSPGRVEPFTLSGTTGLENSRSRSAGTPLARATGPA